VATAAEVGAIDGNIARNIAVERHTKTERLRTGLAARREETLSATDRPAPGNRLAGRAAICLATAAEQESVTGLAVEESVTEPAVQELVIEAAEAIESETGISPAVVVETGMRSAGDLKATADRTLAPTAAAALPVWDLEAEAVEVEAVGDAGRRRVVRKEIHGSTE
jgi:hypothetical protein